MREIRERQCLQLASVIGVAIAIYSMSQSVVGAASPQGIGAHLGVLNGVSSEEHLQAQKFEDILRRHRLAEPRLTSDYTDNKEIDGVSKTDATLDGGPSFYISQIRIVTPRQNWFIHTQHSDQFEKDKVAPELSPEKVKKDDEKRIKDIIESETGADD